MTFPSLPRLLNAAISTYAVATSGDTAAPETQAPAGSNAMTMGTRNDGASGPVAPLSTGSAWNAKPVVRQLLGTDDNTSTIPFGTEYQVQYRDGTNETFNVAPPNCGGLEGTPAYSYSLDEDRYHGLPSATKCSVDGAATGYESVRMHTFELDGAPARELAEVAPSLNGHYVPGNSSSVDCNDIYVDGGGNFGGFIKAKQEHLHLVESVIATQVPCDTSRHYSGANRQGSWSDVATASMAAAGAYVTASLV